jgi:hypothetical protein
MDDMNAHGKEFSLIFNEDKKKKNSGVEKKLLIFLMQEL